MTMTRLLDCNTSEEFRKIALENSNAIISKSLQVEEALKAFIDLEGSSDLNSQSVSLKRLLDEVIDGYEPEFKKTGIRLVKYHGFGGVAYLDVSKMRRVVANLIQNAIEAQPEGGELVISTSQKWFSKIEISVKTPTFIPPQQVKSLFNRYFSFGKSGGTGLGLSIVKKFTELHGGTASCVSGPGLGTVFTLRLPKG